MNTPSKSSSALSLTVIGGLLRLLPHAPNFAPVGAMSLFSSAEFDFISLPAGTSAMTVKNRPN